MKNFKLSNGEDLEFNIYNEAHFDYSLIIFNSDYGIFSYELNDFKFLIDNFNGEDLNSKNLDLKIEDDFINFYIEHGRLILSIPAQDFCLLKDLVFEIEKNLALQ